VSCSDIQLIHFHNLFFSLSDLRPIIIASQYIFDSRVKMTKNQTTLLQLQEMFRATHYSTSRSSYFRIVDNIKYNVESDEVWPNLFVGNGEAAENKEYLKKVGITHIVNMAEDDVDTDASYYIGDNIQYLGMPLADTTNTKIDDHFQVVSKFIEKGISTGGKVLVHCYMGFSRSATCAIAYLMMCEGMSAVDACQTVRAKHVCRPNEGFLQQLANLDNQKRL